MKQRLPQSRFKHPGFIRFSSTDGDSGQNIRLKNYQKYIFRLLNTRPVVFWGWVWLSIALVSTVALGSLLSPSSSSQRPPAQIAADAQATVVTEPEVNPTGRFPFWIFGAIALLCGGSSFLIARYLKFSQSLPLKQAKSSVKASKPVQETVSSSPPAQHPKPSRELKPFSPTAPLPFPVLPTFAQPIPQPEAEPVNPRRIHEQSARNNLIAWLIQDVDYTQPSLVNPLGSLPGITTQEANPQPIVTVVPADESHPLDWTDKPAGKSVDRHRLRSLQAWLAEMS
jgi:hypothetical protein